MLLLLQTNIVNIFLFILQPILTAAAGPPKLSLRDVLLQMRLYSMASIIEQAQLEDFLKEAGKKTNLAFGFCTG